MPLTDREVAVRRRKRQELSNMASKVVFNTMVGLVVTVCLYIGHHLWRMG